MVPNLQPAVNYTPDSPFESIEIQKNFNSDCVPDSAANDEVQISHTFWRLTCRMATVL